MFKESLIKKLNNKINNKYYLVNCPYISKSIRVKGIWQYKYARYLNKNNILWDRKKAINLTYTLKNDQQIYTYYPDFYLIETDQYVQIKSEQNQQYNEKIKLITQQNKQKKIKVFDKDKIKQLPSKKILK